MNPHHILSTPIIHVIAVTDSLKGILFIWVFVNLTAYFPNHVNILFLPNPVKKLKNQNYFCSHVIMIMIVFFQPF